jgi:sarcosine oxidase
MSDRYDVIVVGVGGMGSTAAYHLAFRGAETLGLERFDIPNDQGSSHGITRSIRKGQYEDPEYVPLAERSYELWGELEDATGRDLLQVTGGIDAESPDGNIFPSSRDSCRKHDITHKILTGEEVNERFPGYDLPAGHCAVYQPESGFLVPGQCIIAHVEAAQREGTKLRAREAVADVSTSGDGAEVMTNRATYRADEVIMTAGAWAREFLPELADVLVPVRRVLAWLQRPIQSCSTQRRFRYSSMRRKRNTTTDSRGSTSPASNSRAPSAKYSPTWRLTARPITISTCSPQIASPQKS